MLNNTTHESVNYVRLFSGKKDEAPYFGLKGNKESGYKITDTYNELNGVSILDIELGTYEYEGKTKHTIKISFEDKLGKTVLESSLNTGIMRSMLNTFCGADFLVPFDLKLYLNKKGYPSVYIKQGADTPSWKYAPSDFPQPEKLKNSKGIEVGYDDSNVVEWLQKLVNEELRPRLSYYNKPPQSQTKLPDTPTPKETWDKNEIDTLPF